MAQSAAVNLANTFGCSWVKRRSPSSFVSCTSLHSSSVIVYSKKVRLLKENGPFTLIPCCWLESFVLKKSSPATLLAQHQLTNVLNRGAAVAQKLLVECLQVETLALLSLQFLAQVVNLGVAGEIAAELHLRERGPQPLALGLGALLEALGHQHFQSCILADVVDVHGMVEDGIERGAHVPLVPEQPHFVGVVAVAAFQHHALRVHSPALNHGAVAEDGLHQRR